MRTTRIICKDEWAEAKELVEAVRKKITS